MTIFRTLFNKYIYHPRKAKTIPSITFEDIINIFDQDERILFLKKLLQAGNIKSIPKNEREDFLKNQEMLKRFIIAEEEHRDNIKNMKSTIDFIASSMQYFDTLKNEDELSKFHEILPQFPELEKEYTLKLTKRNI